MIYVLRLLHILAGAFWYGTVIFMARFLMPSIKAAGPSGGQVMAQLVKRRVPVAMMGAAFLNVASGIALFFVASGGAPGNLMRTGMGRTLGIGALFALLALTIGMIIGPPNARRLGRMAEAVAKRGTPATPEEAAEMARIQKLLDTGTIIGAVLMTLAVSAMAVARYVP